MKYRYMILAATATLFASCSKPSSSTSKASETPVAPTTTTEAVKPAPAPTPAPAPAAPVFASAFMKQLAPHLKYADGKPVAESELTSPKMTLLYFSASWCGPCKMFTPKLIEQYKTLQAAGIQVVLANRDKDTASMLEYMTSHSQPWPGLPPEVQSNKTIDLSAFTERGIPSLALIDAEGKLVKKGIAWTLLPELLKDLPKP